MKGIKDYFEKSNTKNIETPQRKLDTNTNENNAKSIDKTKEKAHSSNNETPKNAPMNAFQFLMNSRNKIIGTNSPGKELNEEKSPIKISKEKLNGRKKLLENWSDTKKSAKRKLEDEEIDACIKVKLDRRKKRFKKILKVQESSDENSRDATVNHKKLSSDDDFESNFGVKKKKKHKKKKRNECETPSKSWKMRIKLTSDDPFTDINIEKTEDIEVDENIEIDTNKEANDTVIVKDIPEKRNLRSRDSLQKPRSYADYSDRSDDEIEVKKRKSKVASVFSKSLPKPMEDPVVVEARRKFLMSEMPEELRKRIQKQERVIVPEFDVFPKISHIFQESPHDLYNGLDFKLPLKQIEPLNYTKNELICKNLNDLSIINTSKYDDSKPLKNIKTIIRNIKIENSTYPVYKSFRQLKEKYSKNNFSMWTEKYRANSSEDLMGNFQAIATLKTWLESWNETLKNRKNYSTSDSESDFISSDSESTCRLKNGIILSGPSGCGKSSSIYAICNELNFEIIELNASSRRTGKQVMQELQEATQSHHVRKNEKSDTKQQKKTKKMCVLLIEDIDIIFEQDDGFVVAISQIASTTKRPIIVTTTDENSHISQKFMNEFKTIKFKRIPTKNLTIWTQILCLIEGYFVDLSTIHELFEYNQGDVRKSLLNLQYWIESGAQIDRNKNITNTISNFDNSNLDDEEIVDDDVSLKEFAGKLENYRIHQNILADFEVLQNERIYDVPLRMNLSKIWWNIPKFLNFDSNDWNPLKKTKRTKQKLEIISRAFDNLAICDVSYGKIRYDSNVSICDKRWTRSCKDSLRVEEIYDDFDEKTEFIKEWNHFLIDSSLRICKEKFHHSSDNQRILNMGLPGFNEKCKSMKDHELEEELMFSVPFSNHLDRKSVAMDYLSSLRGMARVEKQRAQHNSKRNNRFYNYLQNFNIDCSKTVINFATNSLIMKET